VMVLSTKSKTVTCFSNLLVETAQFYESFLSSEKIPRDPYQ